MKAALWAALLLAGMLSGYINTLAGSGSLVTLPVLILLGLPAGVANGTNRVGVLLQNLVAAASFARSGKLDLKGSLGMTLLCVTGAVFGASLAVSLDETLLRRCLAVLMLAMLGVMLLRPERWLQAGQPHPHRLTLALGAGYLAAGLYGGFIQAGVGIVLLTLLVLGSGFDLVRANALKNWLVLSLTAISLVVFVRNGQVDWTAGLVLGLGSMLGAWLAARTALQKGAVFLHRFVMAVVLVSAADMLGLFRWLGHLLSGR